MQLSPEQFHTLFDRAAQPVLLVQDGVITQCSSRAEGLIAPGSPDPGASAARRGAAGADRPPRPTVLPLRLRTGYVTAQVQPLEGALLLFLPVGDDDALHQCAFPRRTGRLRPADDAFVRLRDHFPASGGRGGSGPAAESGGAQPVVLSAAASERESWRLERRTARRLPLSMEKTDLTDFLDDFSQTAGDLCLQAGRELDVELPQAPSSSGPTGGSCGGCCWRCCRTPSSLPRPAVFCA